MQRKLGLCLSGVMLFLIPLLTIGTTITLAPPYYNTWDTSVSYSSPQEAFEAGMAGLLNYYSYAHAPEHCAGRYSLKYVPPGIYTLNQYMDIAQSSYNESGDHNIDVECAQYWTIILIPRLSADPHRSPGAPCCDGGLAVGNPINIGEKLKFEIESDYANRDLVFERYYSSGGIVDATHIGARWRNSFDLSIKLYNETGNANGAYAVASRADGKQYTFYRQDGVWHGPSDVADMLSEEDDATTGLVNGLSYRTSNRVEHYAANGVLKSISYGRGRNLELAYSDASTPVERAPALGLLLSVTDSTGRSLQFTYNQDSTIRSILLPDGGVISYAYAVNGDLIAVTREDGSVRTYLYNEPSQIAGGASIPHALTGIIDESGTRYSFYGYDADGRAISTELAGDANQYTVNYDSRILYYPANQYGVRPYSYFAFSEVNGIQKIGLSKNNYTSSATRCAMCLPFQTADYDTNGNLKERSNFKGGITTYAFGSDGLERSRTDSDYWGIVRVIETTWDSRFPLPLSKTTKNGAGTLVSKMSWTYNDAGDVVAKCEIDPAAAPTYVCSNVGPAPTGVRRWVYSYCAAVDGTRCPLTGLLLSVSGPRTDVDQTATYSYYLSDDTSECSTSGAHCHRAGDLYQVENALGQRTTYNSYDAAGRITRITDANGVHTDMRYTARGWLSKRTVGGAATSLTYTPYGAVASITDPSGIVNSFSYDSAHRLADVTDAQGNVVHYTLDGAGNRVREEVRDASGNVRRSLSRQYDSLGRLAAVVDGLNNKVFKASSADGYDRGGDFMHSSDALGNELYQARDAYGRLNFSIDDWQGVSSNQSTFDHDALDRLDGVTDPDGLDTLYTYDSFGNRTEVVSPDTGISESTYDVAGNLTAYKDAKGQVGNLSYDALDRITSRSYGDTSQNVYYYYDEANTLTGCASSKPKGRLTRIVEHDVTTVYCYSGRGKVLEKRQITNNLTATVKYAYTIADRLHRITTPDNTVVTYTYNSVGLPKSVSIVPSGGSTVSNVVSAITWLPFGPVSSYKLGNGQLVQRTYDANYALTDISSPAFELHLARDAMGNVVAIGSAPGANPATETYSYDAEYRLTAVKDGAGSMLESYTYSSTGDRLSKSAANFTIGAGTYAYAPNTHWLASIGNASRSIDANGNTTATVMGGNAYEFGYDALNRLVLAKTNGQTVATYGYNTLGERITKVSTGSVTPERYAYNEESQLIGEYGTSNVDYVWLGEIPVAVINNTINGSVTTSDVNYITSDQMGTPRAVSNNQGVTIWSWAYLDNPFGERMPTSSVGYVLNLRYPGQYYDAETGTHYNRLRTYEPATGRYLQSDPIGIGAGPSTYGYANQSPLNFSDVDGTEAFARGPFYKSISTIYCDGAGSIAIWLIQQNPCWDDCVRAHEGVHRADALRSNPTVCAGQAAGTQVYLGTKAETYRSEVRAYDKELDCLQKKLAALGNCDKCRKDIEDKIEAERTAKSGYVYWLNWN